MSARPVVPELGALDLRWHWTLAALLAFPGLAFMLLMIPGYLAAAMARLWWPAA